MEKELKELLEKILANQELIIKALKIKPDGNLKDDPPDEPPPN